MNNEKRDLKKEYEDMIHKNRVFVFMKGNPTQPMCGFSLRVVSLLSELDVEFETFDILEDIEIRQEIKKIANWPTYPQVYVNGDLVGGCEIIEELFRNGELQSLLEIENN